MAVRKYINETFKQWRWIVYSLIVLVGLSFLGFMFILLGGRFVVDDQHFVFSESTILQTEDGDEIIKLYDKNRTYVPIEQVPEHVIDAFLAIEDHRFYEHSGVDFWSVTRAIYRDVTSWSKAEGASTITQQLVKNTSLTNDKSWLRKTKEVMGAIYLERHRSKDEILEYYLNEIYFGNGVYGIEEAAQTFYSKSVAELSISEGALLAALPKAPNYYSPTVDEERALERRNVVLSRMYDVGMLDAETMRHERGKTLGLEMGESKESPWLSSYVDVVLEELEEDYHLTREEIYTGGYLITVGLDQEAQEIAYQEMQKDEYFQGSKDNIEGATVILDQTTGLIRAAIGGRNYQQGDLNRIDVRRQPGSTIKPLAVYGPALEESDYHPYSILPDEIIDYDGYSPHNIDDVYEGEVTMYDALRVSKNTTAVALLNEIGVSQGLEYMKEVGVELPDDGLSVALGGLSEGLSPLELTSLYRAFYNEGRFIEPYAVIEVEDRQGDILEGPNHPIERLFSSQTSWYLTRMLQAVVTDGTAQVGKYQKDLAGKTGTTQHPQQSNGIRDAWFVGFNTEYVMASWIGYDISDEDHYLTAGSRTANALAESILAKLDDTKDFQANFEKPEHVNDLEPPVQLPVIHDLSADVSLGFRDGLHVELNWTASKDERVKYHIYREIDGKVDYLDTVTGVGSYQIRQIRMFDNPSYYVVPVNPLNDVEGESSNKDSAF
ncbi:transglycosylase domain-containing protein [Alkalibacillus aidingensis]|uniref:transglycosylase domain-containing protein n=1 Tax=Alkalibacillus aidingensis TaxID=2747607 RepID=UPI001660B5D2|nr:PBP1A family penicillin-binding protein [Alkalibacillus aidingensis]